MNDLQSSMNQFFGRKRRRRLYAVDQSGRAYPVERRNGAYWWKPGAGSYPLEAARENAAREGITLEWRSE